MMTRRSRFALVLIGQGTNVLGNGLAPIALSFAVLDVSGSTTLLGVVLAVREVVAVVAGLLSGAVADRWPKLLTLGLGNACAALSQLGVAIIIFTGSESPILLVCLAAVNGLMASLTGPAVFSILAVTVDPENRQRSNSWYRICTTLALLLGSAVGGVLVTFVGSGYALVADRRHSSSLARVSASRRQVGPKGHVGQHRCQS